MCSRCTPALTKLDLVQNIQHGGILSINTKYSGVCSQATTILCGLDEWVGEDAVAQSTHQAERRHEATH